MRVVLDTNIIVSWMLSKLGAPARIVTAWRTQAIVLEVIVSEWLLAEYERALNYPSVRRRHQRSAKEVHALVDEFRRFGVMVEPAEVPAIIIQDSDDNNVLACAIAGEADYIVSGDPHLVDLREYEGIRILSPAAFMALLDEGHA